jgi:hypothetical protein
MENQVQIVFRHMPPSEAVDGSIREWIASVEAVCHRITRCRVTVEAPGSHAHHGGLYRVRVELDLPSHHIVVGRSPGDHQEHQDVQVAVRDALRAARRALERHTARPFAPDPAAGESRD